MTVPMPKIQPVPFNTKGKPWWMRGYIWIFKTRQWMLLEDYKLWDCPLIPSFFVFDGASVPKPLRGLVSPTGALFIPAMIHDFGYRYDPGKKGKLYWDRLFRNLSLRINGIWILSWGAWLSVFGFSWVIWWNYRRKDKDK